MFKYRKRFIQKSKKLQTFSQKSKKFRNFGEKKIFLIKNGKNQNSNFFFKNPKNAKFCSKIKKKTKNFPKNQKLFFLNQMWKVLMKKIKLEISG